MKKLDTKTRFYSLVKKEPNDGCWLWIGSCTWNGYGRFHYNGRPKYSHRVSWMLENGEIPKGLRVLHKCDIRNCIRPSHLFLGTAKENSLDMVAKGRNKNGFTGVTHCKNNHRLDGIDWRGDRYCKTCKLEWQRKSRAKKKAISP